MWVFDGPYYFTVIKYVLVSRHYEVVLTYIYHFYPKFWVDSSVKTRPVKVTASSRRKYTEVLVVVSLTSCVHCSEPK